jgi:hypothetical protein
MLEMTTRHELTGVEIVNSQKTCMVRTYSRGIFKVQGSG